MKLSSLFTICFVFMLIACNTENVEILQEEQTITNQLENDEIAFRESDQKVKLVCSGSCGCAVQAHGLQYAECSCDPCILNIEFIDEYGNHTVLPLEQDKYEVEFLAELETHIQNTYGTNEYLINFIEISTSGNEKLAYLYDFTVAGHIDDSILFYTDTAVDKKFKVACAGDCGCRARYVFDPPAAECTCVDCVMTVDEINPQAPIY